MGYTFGAQTTDVAGTNPFSATMADVNGDGHADLVVANQDESAIRIDCQLVHRYLQKDEVEWRSVCRRPPAHGAMPLEPRGGQI